MLPLQGRAQSCAVLVMIAPEGMQACSSLPGRVRGLTWLSHASFTSRGCRVSHAAQPGSSPLGRSGMAARLGSLLAPLHCSLCSPGALEEQMSGEEGWDPSVGGMGTCYSRLSTVLLGW